MSRAISGQLHALLNKDNVLIVGFCLVWLLAFYSALLSAVAVWASSDTFVHCFLIVPCALYLIWRERNQLLAEAPTPAWWCLLPLAAVLMVGLIGHAGDVQLLSHVAAFSSLPLLAVLCIGSAAKVIWFPLLFILFSVPIGDELIPLFQQITALIAVQVLEFTDVPVFRNGLYLDIPNGRFVIAEACSGVRFFIATLTFGALYAHLEIRSRRRQLAYLVLVITLPVLANGVRVVGVILIGHFFGMEHARGTDHLVYGWLFFALVMLLLLAVGQLFRGTPLPKHPLQQLPAQGWSLSTFKAPLAMAGLLLFIVAVWQQSLPVGPAGSHSINRAGIAAVPVLSTDWQPVFAGSADRYHGVMPAIDYGGQPVEIFLAWYDYDGRGAELVSSANRWYRAAHWSVVGRSAVTLLPGANVVDVRLTHITSPQGSRRVLLTWYQLPRWQTASPIEAKLIQTFARLGGQTGQGAAIALSLRYRLDSDMAERQILDFASANFQTILSVLPLEQRCGGDDGRC